MKKTLFILSALLFFTACSGSDQDPYGGNEPVDGAPKPKVEDPKEKPGADSLLIPDRMFFSEGTKAEYIVTATVAGSGSPELRFNNLPTGVVYDKATHRLTWTPDYKAANDPARPDLVVREYYVEVVLTSSENPANIVKSKQVTLVVNDTSIPANLLSPADAVGTEGQLFTHEIKFKDPEYPNGPFDVSISGLPADVVVDWPDRRIPTFRFVWTPKYDKIVNKAQDTFNGRVVISNPRSTRRLDFNVVWTIKNRTVEPTVTGPTNVIERGDIDFLVLAEDINNEAPPVWSFKVAVPYGLSSITNNTVPGAPRPQSSAAVSWKAIPADKLGVPVTLELQACVQFAYCTTHRVMVIPQAMILEGAPL